MTALVSIEPQNRTSPFRPAWQHLMYTEQRRAAIDLRIANVISMSNPVLEIRLLGATTNGSA